MDTKSRSTLISAAVLTAFVATALPARADCPAFSSFEGGTLTGWLSATTGGSGSTSVQEHNGSNAGYVQHTGNGSHSLSCDTPYVADALVQFDMHAVANAGERNTQALSGVKISFLNAFNVPLGSFGLYNATSTLLLGAHDEGVDMLQHHYAATMASFAAAAGLAPAAAIAKTSIAFLSYAQTDFVYSSAAAVWFDNVAIAAVPEPSQHALLLAGLAAMGLFVRRRRGAAD